MRLDIDYSLGTPNHTAILPRMASLRKTVGTKKPRVFRVRVTLCSTGFEASAFF